ncbi:MAG: hypothetical protein PSY14_13615 [bacterium]|nr:hypothetical protein [bacterium]
MRKFAILGFLFLAACASPAERQAKMDRWIGASERDLVSTWGIPDKTYQLDRGTRMLSYVEIRNRETGSSFNTCLGGYGGRFGYSNCIGAYPPARQTTACETTFMLVQGRVSKWGLKGSGC